MRLTLPQRRPAQPSDTAELVEKLEDAQMALGAMASNRFGGPFREEVGAWLGKLGVISEQVRSPLLATCTSLEESLHRRFLCISFNCFLRLCVCQMSTSNQTAHATSHLQADRGLT